MLSIFGRVITGLCLIASAGLAAAEPTSRDPWQWPFAATSIWNMPIGSGAVYRAANFQAAGHVGVDTQIILALSASDPLRQCYLSTTFGPGRDEGTESIDFWLRLPDAWLVPDAGISPYGATPNSNFALRRWGAEADLVQEGSMITRSTVGGPFYLPDFVRWPNNRKVQSITGSGVQGGGQGASGMSALGGTLRRGELTGSAPIRHALKVNPWAAKYCHYSTEVPGFKWPAWGADSYASSNYNRTADPAIVMGALFAIPPGVTTQSLGLTTEPGRKLFAAMQDYGMYFTEDAAWDTWDLIVERYEEDDFAQLYGFSMGSATWKAEVNKLMQALSVITNNTASSIGGGGTPRQPLAPPFVGANSAPSVSAGPDRTITLPATAALDGTRSDDGLPSGGALTSTWSKVSGPGMVTFGSTTAVDTTAAFSVAGTYVLRLSASDTLLSAYDDVRVVVNAAPVNNAPSVSAGPDRTVTLPATAALAGTRSDDGLPSGGALTSTWRKVSGPGTVTFGNSAAVATTAAFSVAGTYVLRLTASDSLLSTSDTVQVVVNAAPAIPTGWSSQDLGTATPAGSAFGDGEAWTIRGGGPDIWNSTDGGRFAWQTLTGNNDLVVRVVSQTNTNAWAKAGLMIRESSAAGSRHVSLVVTPGNGVALQYRSTTNGSSSHVAGPKVAAPTWLKLTRRGNVFTGWQSANGTTWTQVGSRTVAIPASALVGLVVSSHSTTTVSTAVFAGFSVLPVVTN